MKSKTSRGHGEGRSTSDRHAAARAYEEELERTARAYEEELEKNLLYANARTRSDTPSRRTPPHDVPSPKGGTPPRDAAKPKAKDRDELEREAMARHVAEVLARERMKKEAETNADLRERLKKEEEQRRAAERAKRDAEREKEREREREREKQRAAEREQREREREADRERWEREKNEWQRRKNEANPPWRETSRPTTDPGAERGGAFLDDAIKRWPSRPTRRDCEALLETYRGAPGADRKKVFRALTLRTHPDKGGDSEAFKLISEQRASFLP